MNMNEFLYTDQVISLEEFDTNNCHEGNMCYEIEKALFEITGFKVDDLLKKDRRPDKVLARHIAMYFYTLSGKSLQTIGERFARDHATIIHARRKIKDFYGQCSEVILTRRMDMMAEYTGINHRLGNYEPVEVLTAVNEMSEVTL
jgi:hypothetical protein